MRLSTTAAIGTLLLATVAAAPAADYEIDPVHSTLVFNVDHAGVAPVYGMFTDFAGAFTFDPEDLANSSVEATVQADSVFTANEQRDGHLRGADFFDVGQYPTISFSGTGFTATDDEHTYTIEGELTMLGTSQPVTLTAIKTGEIAGHERFGTRVGFEVHLTIERSAYGMTYGIDGNVLGDAVELVVAIEGIEQ